MALCNATEAGSAVVQAKRKTILEDWDKRRMVELGEEAGSWEVLYCSTGSFFCVLFCFLFSLFPLSFRSTLIVALRSKVGTPVCTPRRSDASS